MPQIIFTAQSMSLTGPEYCPFGGHFGVGGGHGSRVVISGYYDEIFGYIIPQIKAVKGKESLQEC